MSEEPKSCPFCSWIGLTYEMSDRKLTNGKIMYSCAVSCDNCGGRGPTWECDKKEIAIDNAILDWNRMGNDNEC